MSDVNDATCNPLRSRQYLSGPLVQFVTVQNNGPNGQGDIQVNLANPCNSFMIVSRKGGTENNSIFFHLTKLNKNYTGVNVASTATGTEQWFSMNTLPATGPNYLSFIRFKETIMTFFLDIGFEGGAGPITIACFADDELSVNGGLYT